MRYRDDMSLPAIILFLLVCIWLRRIRMLVAIICAILSFAILMIFICTKKVEAKNEEERMRAINFQMVYDFLARIPAGKVVTYGMVAEYLGDKRLARTVGNILQKNPDWKKYPCYKVVSYDGKLSKGYAFGGIEKQKELLMKENIEVKGYKVDLNRYRWEYGKDL